MHPEEVREKAISLVKQGISINRTARMLNLNPAIVSRWCQKAGVKSRHKQIVPKKHIPDDKIIEVIKKKKVVTSRELNEILGAILTHRLKRLVREGKIKSTKIPKIRSHIVKKYMSKYINVTLYFIDEKSFRDWYYSKLPKHIPKHLKKIFTHVLTDIGIKVEEKKQTKTAIILPKHVKQQLLERAKQEGVTVEEFLEEVVKR